MFPVRPHMSVPVWEPQQDQRSRRRAPPRSEAAALRWPASAAQGISALPGGIRGPKRKTMLRIGRRVTRHLLEAGALLCPAVIIDSRRFPTKPAYSRSVSAVLKSSHRFQLSLREQRKHSHGGLVVEHKGIPYSGAVFEANVRACKHMLVRPRATCCPANAVQFPGWFNGPPFSVPFKRGRSAQVSGRLPADFGRR